MYLLIFNRSETFEQKSELATTNSNEKITKEIAVGSNLKYGATIFVTIVNIGEKTTTTKVLQPK